jgi:hypothetical protein
MVYTCFEMIRDCRADVPQGWRHFASSYVPVIRRILKQYGAGEMDMDPILLSLRKSSGPLFQSMDPSPERWFVAELRQVVLASLAVPEPEIALDLATVAEALAPLTMVEKQAAWLDTMRYDVAVSGEMLRISGSTVEKVRARAAELIRGKVDAWNRTLLAENGLALGREAAGGAGKDCLSAKAFLDILDGRTTWGNKEMMERQVNSCWHCVDRPLTDAEAAPYWKLLGVGEKKAGWKRLFA